jgi:ABC-type sugar transport system ATPase subunit
MDEPTRGIDVGAKEEIYEHVRTLAESGTSVLLLSSEYQELINICDSIMILHPTGVAGPFDPRETTGEKILSISLGVD